MCCFLIFIRFIVLFFFFFQAEDGIRDLVRSRGLGDVYKRQVVALLSIILHLVELLVLGVLLLILL